MSNKLRMMLFSVAVLALPFFGMKAKDWTPTGDHVNDSGYAVDESDAYQDGDRLTADTANFTAGEESGETTSDTTLNIYGTLNGDTEEGATACPLKVDGEVVLTASDKNMTVNVKTDTIIEPYRSDLSGGTEGEGYSHLVFDVASGKKITVNCLYNLAFRGKTISVLGALEDTDTYSHMLITFKGAGRTIFNMYDGTKVEFLGDIDENEANGMSASIGSNGVISWAWNGDSFTSAAGGTKVFVTMEQTKDSVDSGQSKVVFQRKNNSDASKRTLVRVGKNSIFTFISDNPTGAVDTEGAYADGGYAAVEFDSSNPAGTGRMVLFIDGAYKTGWQDGLTGGEDGSSLFLKLSKLYPFNDGAFVVAGHYVPDFTSSSIRTALDFSSPAGIKAIMRVTDNQAYASRANPTQTYAPESLTTTTKRGLLIINDVHNHGKLAADPFLDFYNSDKLGNAYAYTTLDTSRRDTNVRFGYVLGINGELDIFDNTFVDYTAGAVNQVDAVAKADYADYPNYLKAHNPSALIIDGLDDRLFYKETADSEAQSFFTAADPSLGAAVQKAKITLRGNANLYLKCAASTSHGYMYNFWVADATDPSAYDPLDDATIDFDKVLLVNEKNDAGELVKVAYDGYQLANNTLTKTGEGEHVLDIAGRLNAENIDRSTLYTDPYATTLSLRSYTTPTLKAGTIGMSSILRTYNGTEGNIDDTGTVVALTRPLLADSSSTYARYNSPAICVNHMADFTGLTIEHSDATKYVSGNPTSAEPAIIGGDKLFFALTNASTDTDKEKDRYRMPEIRLYNSTLALHESLNATGVRLVVKDIPVADSSTTANTTYSNSSAIKYYDHGDALDTLLTGYGRVLQFGSSNSLMSDSLSNYVTESAYVNVFKGNKPLLRASSAATDTSSKVTLSIKDGNEFPSTLATASYNKQRAHHLFMLSVPTSDNASCYMSLGWTTTVGAEGSYPYPGESPQTAGATKQFVLNAIHATRPAAPATLSIDCDLVTFGSLDKNGNSIKVPLSTNANSGAVYVNHGGRIASGTSTTTSKPCEVYFDTMLGQELNNDYSYLGDVRECLGSGIIDLVQDQVTFGKNYSIQPYGFTKDLFDNRRDITLGYVRVSGENSQATSTRSEKSCSEELTFGWYYRDVDSDFAAVKSAPLSRHPGVPSGIKSFLTRATESFGTPVDVTGLNLLYIGAGDDIKQIRVACATMADPFHLDVSGDATRPLVARVREFASLKTTRDLTTEHFIGEGAHAVLFVECGGRIGLGTRHYNEHSLNAWNILGKDYVCICPLGDGVVDVNSNVIVADKQALIPSAKFGSNSVQRITFTSVDPVEIRIPAGGELDLSGFGQSTYQQQICFGGKVSLILEEGASIRFPSSPTGGVVLYFNDNSRLVFEGTVDPIELVARNANAAASQYGRTKILGKGQIWGNKHAIIEVNGRAFVGVQSDSTTPATDVTISLQRSAGMYIGDSNVAGGAFEVGNTAAVTNGSVSFTLTLNGPDAVFHIDREGYLGLGAGVINKFSNPNGGAARSNNPEATSGAVTVSSETGYPVFHPDDTLGTDESGQKAWAVYALKNVNTININMQNGAFEHKNIFDGSNSQASLMAIGPAATYNIRLNTEAYAYLRGGGNLMYVPDDTSIHYANIWDYAGETVGGEMYSILGSGLIMLSRSDLTASSVPYVVGSKLLTYTDHYDAFCALSALSYETMVKSGNGYVSVGSTPYNTVASYINKGTNSGDKIYPTDVYRIVRVNNPQAVNGKVDNAFKRGVMNSRNDGGADPTVFALLD
jgi:hypothetical protein